MALEIDWSALAQDIGHALVAEFTPILKAEASDVKTFAFHIADRMVVAARAGDTAWTEELKAQIRGLGEACRIRVNAGGWDMVEQIGRIAFKVVLAAVGSIK